MEKQEHSLAYELAVELKASAKRWFIIAMAELVVILAMAGGMLWYFSLPAEEVSDTQTVEDIKDSDVTQNIGDSYGESNTD